MSIDIEELRKAANCIFIAVEKPIAQDISDRLNAAADEISWLQGENKRMIAQIIEAVSILKIGSDYEKLHVPTILMNGLPQETPNES